MPKGGHQSLKESILKMHSWIKFHYKQFFFFCMQSFVSTYKYNSDTDQKPHGTKGNKLPFSRTSVDISFDWEAFFALAHIHQCSWMNDQCSQSFLRNEMSICLWCVGCFFIVARIEPAYNKKLLKVKNHSKTKRSFN